VILAKIRFYWRYSQVYWRKNNYIGEVHRFIGENKIILANWKFPMIFSSLVSTSMNCSSFVPEQADQPRIGLFFCKKTKRKIHIIQYNFAIPDIMKALAM
jgi:hypothetical protein